MWNAWPDGQKSTVGPSRGSSIHTHARTHAHTHQNNHVEANAHVHVSQELITVIGFGTFRDSL